MQDEIQAVEVVHFVALDASANEGWEVRFDEVGGELDESFTVTLSNPVDGMIDTATAAGIIRNDDAEPSAPSGGGVLADLGCIPFAAIPANTVIGTPGNDSRRSTRSDQSLYTLQERAFMERAYQFS